MAANKIPRDTLLYFVIIFLIGAVAGFWLKSALKSKITNSPDDRRVVAEKQDFNFKAIQDKLEKEAAEMQNAPGPGEAQIAVPQE
jgi:hypothetical protein